MLPKSGQSRCFDSLGGPIPCRGSGQDGEFCRGHAIPSPRFRAAGDTLVDRGTGLIWSRDAAPFEFPQTWQEALSAIAELNRHGYLDHDDWRLPNRRELRSLVDHDQPRVFAADHPFENLFRGWYWSSTSAAIAPRHAWYVDMAGGRMFYGGKDQSFMAWPVRGSGRLLATGQRRCFDARGESMPCRAAPLQDGAQALGIAWDEGRFTPAQEGFIDRLTGLEWHLDRSGNRRPLNWRDALARIPRLNEGEQASWRLPNIVELESLVDADQARPALSPALPRNGVRESYWSSTTSAYETDWAWALYLEKGAIGVGQKKDPHFYVIAVRDAAEA